MPRVPFKTNTKFLAELRESVLRFAHMHYGASGLSAEDLTQEALTWTFDNVRCGRLTTLTSSLKTYVINILKNVAREQLRVMDHYSSGNATQDDDDDLPPVDLGMAQEAIDRWMEQESDDERDELQNAVYDIVTKMKDPCKSGLWSYYWEDMSMKEIADMMGYSNARVATSQKSRCMNKVKEVMEELLKKMRS